MAFLGGFLMFVIVLPLWFFYLRSRVRRQVAKQMSEPNTQKETEVTIDATGFRERTEANDCFHSWDGVEFVGLTPDHLFVHETPLTAYIVPLDELNREALELVREAVPATKFLETGA